MREEQNMEPEPTYMEREEIFALAEKTAKRQNYRVGDTIEKVVEKLGGKGKYVEFTPWFEDDSIYIQVNDKKDFTVYIPDYGGPLRCNVIIANALGYYFLHSKQGKESIRVERGSCLQLHTEARQFAAAFLMPRKSFIRDFENPEKDLISLAGKYQVPAGRILTYASGIGLSTKATEEVEFVYTVGDKIHYCKKSTSSIAYKGEVIGIEYTLFSKSMNSTKEQGKVYYIRNIDDNTITEIRDESLICKYLGTLKIRQKSAKTPAR